MHQSTLVRPTCSLVLIIVLCQLAGCQGAAENKVIAPQQSEEALRQETDAKIEAAKNSDPSLL